MDAADVSSGFLIGRLPATRLPAGSEQGVLAGRMGGQADGAAATYASTVGGSDCALKAEVESA